MTKVISLVNTKGGVSKTTIAYCLAVYWDLKEKHCMIIDTDPQGSIRQWLSMRSNVGNMCASGVDLSRLKSSVDTEIKSDDHDFIIIDTPGRLSEINPAIDCADIVIVPCEASMASYGALQQSLPHIKKRAKNMILVPVQTKTPTDVEDVIGFLNAISPGTPIAKPIHDRRDYRSGLTSGLSIIDLKNKKGIEEVSSLASDIEEILNG